MKRLIASLSLAVICTLVLCLSAPAVAQPPKGAIGDVSVLSVTGIVPAMAPNHRDTPVVISGSGFATDGGTPPVVTLGTTPLIGVTFVGETSLTATVPQGMAPGAYDLTVTNPDTGSATLASAFTVTLPPTVTAMDPTSGFNDLDTPVTITGTNFAADASGTVPPAASLSNADSGSVPLTIVGLTDATTLTATVPWGMDAGVYDLTVANPDGGSASLPAVYTVRSAIGHWNGTTMYGGPVSKVQIKPGDGSTLYATTSIAVFRSTDAGANWTALNGSATEDGVILDPLHPTWLYSVVVNSLFRSKDEGDTWTYLPTGVPRGSGPCWYHAYLSPHHPKVIFIGISGWGGANLGLLKSTDGGASWHMVGDLKGDSVNLMALHPTDSGRMVLATTDGRVFQSTDGGDHWSRIAAPVTTEGGGGILMVYNPYRPAEVWLACGLQLFKSYGDPITGWDDVTPPGYGQWTDYFRFTGPYEVYINGYHTTDGGANWGGSYGQEVVFDPVDPQLCYRGDSMYGVMRSSDGGATWTARNHGLAAMTCNSMAVSPTDPQRVYATFDGWPGVFISENGTSDWRYVEVPGCWGVGLLHEDPFDPGRIYAASGNGQWVSGDQGEHWQNLGWNTTPPCPPTGNGPQDRLETDPFQQGHLLVALSDTDTTARLYSSTDSGVSWQAVDLPTRLANIECITGLTFDPEIPGLVFIGIPGKGVYRSTDHGVTWRWIDNRQPGMEKADEIHITIATHPRHVVWVGAGAGGPWVSFDGGDTWSSNDVNDDRLGRFFVFAGDNSTRMYSGTRSGLFFSSDLGHVFTRAAGVLGRLHVTQVACTTASDHMIIYAVTTGGRADTPIEGLTARGAPMAAGAAKVYVGGGVYRYTVSISRVTLQLAGLSEGAIKLGGSVVATGLVTPSRLSGGKVGLQVQRKVSGRWVTVLTVKRTIAAGGNYRWQYRPAKRGAYRLRATISRTANHTYARTRWQSLRVK